MTQKEEFQAAAEWMLPCAKCGDKAHTLIEFRELTMDGIPTFRIMCMMCGNQPEGTEITITQAAEAWNRFNRKKGE